MKIQIREHNFYVDERLYTELQSIKKKIVEKDSDMPICVDGGEGDGKSVFSMQIAKILDESFDVSRVCMTSESFARCIDESQKGQAIIFDEGFRGFSNRRTLSDVNHILVTKMMECRQKNLFIIIVTPSFFMLDRYIALFRTRCLFHIYRYDGQRGFWVCFNQAKKKMLYILGKKFLSYARPKASFSGRFTDYYTINEAEYRKKKLESLKNTEIVSTPSKYMNQRDILFYYCHKVLGISQTKMEKDLSLLNFSIDQTEISRIMTKISRNYAL